MGTPLRIQAYNYDSVPNQRRIPQPMKRIHEVSICTPKLFRGERTLVYTALKSLVGTMNWPQWHSRLRLIATRVVKYNTRNLSAGKHVASKMLTPCGIKHKQGSVRCRGRTTECLWRTLRLKLHDGSAGLLLRFKPLECANLFRRATSISCVTWLTFKP